MKINSNAQITQTFQIEKGDAVPPPLHREYNTQVVREVILGVGRDFCLEITGDKEIFQDYEISITLKRKINSNEDLLASIKF
jgi:hypothetical protein